MNCSQPVSSVHRIFQARILEWVAIPPPGDPPKPRDQIHLPCIGSLDSLPLSHLGSPKHTYSCSYQRCDMKSSRESQESQDRNGRCNIGKQISGNNSGGEKHKYFQHKSKKRITLWTQSTIEPRWKRAVILEIARHGASYSWILGFNSRDFWRILIHWKSLGEVAILF